MEHSATATMMVDSAGPTRFADLNQGMAGPAVGGKGLPSSGSA